MIGLLIIENKDNDMYAKQPDTQRIFMTEAEYLAFSDAQEGKYEYRAGEVFDMVGGTINHAQISANVLSHLAAQLDDSDCSVLTPDARIYIASQTAYRYPDVTVYCGERIYHNNRTDTLTNPVIVVEVTSPSSMARDYGEKLSEYIRIPTLQAYVIVSQEQPKLQVYLRQANKGWEYRDVVGLDGQLAIGLGCVLNAAKVYRRIEWEAMPPKSDTTE